MLSVLPPDMDFPLTAEGKMDQPSAEGWKLASLAINRVLNCRTGPDSSNWQFDKAIKLFRRVEEPSLGYSHGNMDGYWQLNDKYHLTSVRLGPFTSTTTVQHLRIAGPAGERTLAKLDEIPANLVVQVEKDGAKQQIDSDRLDSVVAVVADGRRSGQGVRSLQVRVDPGEAVYLHFSGFEEVFDAQHQYTRVSCDVKGESCGIQLNERTTPLYYNSFYNRAASDLTRGFTIATTRTLEDS